MNDIQEKVVSAVRAYMDSHGITQSECAERLGISQSSVSCVLSQVGFGKNTARKWSQVFGFNQKFLLTGVGPLIAAKSSDTQTANDGEQLLEIIRSQQKTIESLSAALVALTNK